MKGSLLMLSGAALALCSASLALAAPEDLLPPSFSNPPPAPAPAPAPSAAPTAGNSGTTASPPPLDGGAAAGSGGIVQPIPDGGPIVSGPAGSGYALPAGFPTLAELEAMETDEINRALGLIPRFDIPASSRRSLEEIGVIAEGEGGFGRNSLTAQSPTLVRAMLRASNGPVVSRWGHILMRRALASRLNAPQGMDPVEFAALRAAALNSMGESAVARALVQDVDGGNYNRALIDAAFEAYLATGDVIGMCPAARLHGDMREDSDWELLQAMCAAFIGESNGARRQLDRALGTGASPEIDVRLAQRFAGAARDGRRAVTIEWDGVDELTWWRFSLARALGVEIPADLVGDSPNGARFDLAEVMIPASPLLTRTAAADRAGARGVLSSAAMIDLYSQLHASDDYSAEQKADAVQLRMAYAARTPAQRLAALRELWANDGYGRRVLTAFAAARIPVSAEHADDAPQLISAMLAAGLDRNALRWGQVVPEGSEGWALLVLAQPERQQPVSSSALDSFLGDDESEARRKSQFLVAGLAGLGRLEDGDAQSYAETLGFALNRRSPWTDKITRAAQTGNRTMVAMLAGLGMQGTGWERMTPRQLYHIVRSLNAVGLTAEARMIAAEAVARG